MATFNMVEGTNCGPSADGPPPAAGTSAQTEYNLAQCMVNDHIRTGKCGMTVTYVYDNTAHTLTATFSGTAS